MSGQLDFLTAGEQMVQKLLFAGSFFQGESIFTNANGDLAQTIEQTIATLKRSIVLRIAQGKIPMPGTSEPWKLYIVVTENPTLNRADQPGAPFDGKTARMIVQKIVARAARVGIELTDATEVLSGDGNVVWQIVGTVEVAMPTGDSDPEPI